MIAEKITKLPDNVQELIKLKNDNCLSVIEMLKMLGDFENEERNKIEVPPFKSKPSLKNYVASPDELRKLADEIEEWQEYRKKRDAIIKKKVNAAPNMNDICEEFIKIESGLKDKVPSKYQDKVYRLAREFGSGHSGVYVYLLDLINIFE